MNIVDTLLQNVQLLTLFETSILLSGCNGVDGDGDVCNPDNISAFSKYVLGHTHNIGVHFMMADGVSRA
jgi:hypothetical protein